MIIGVYFLYSLLGYSAFVGIAVIPAAAPFSYFIAKYIYSCDRELAAVRDRRIGAIKEFLLGIKVIKVRIGALYRCRPLAHCKLISSMPGKSISNVASMPSAMKRSNGDDIDTRWERSSISWRTRCRSWPS